MNRRIPGLLVAAVLTVIAAAAAQPTTTSSPPASAPADDKIPITRGSDGKLLEEFRGQRVLMSFSEFFRPVDNQPQARAARVKEIENRAKEIEAALAQANVKIVRVVNAGAASPRLLYRLLLLDCQGGRPEAEWRKIPGLEVKFVPPPPDSGGGGGHALLTPKEGSTLLEVFLWTRAGLDLSGQ